jgi:hypothetical protein
MIARIIISKTPISTDSHNKRMQEKLINTFSMKINLTEIKQQYLTAN